MNTRDWPIRAKLTALVIGPVTALLALWIFATSLTFDARRDELVAALDALPSGRGFIDARKVDRDGARSAEPTASAALIQGDHPSIDPASDRVVEPCTPAPQPPTATERDA